MKKEKVTRDYGFFEGFLAKQRAKIADKLISSAARKGRILDIGCGSYPYFLNSIEFSEKYAMDQNLLVTLQESINFQQFDIEKQDKINFPDGYFDIVTMLAVWEHINSDALPAKIKEAYRILKPGGSFIITTPASWTGPILNIMAKLKLISPVEVREHKSLYSRGSILKVLTKCGFRNGKIMSGYFELFMNIWVKAEK